MKLLKVEAQNFGSYKEIKFDFNNVGLALIHGPTGSGKSTLQDLPVWCLFGQTAKGGNADDIRSWTSKNSTVCKLTLESELGKTYTITRIRGSSSQNDLYYTTQDGIDHRGKDITETQKLINTRLGVDAYLYTVGAYYNEFSPTGLFFTAKASERRELFESLANLELPAYLTERIAIVKKDAGKTLTQILERTNKTEGTLEQLKRSQISAERNAFEWKEKQERRIRDFEKKAEAFEQEKQKKISDLINKAIAFEKQRYEDAMLLKKEKEDSIASYTSLHTCVNCSHVRDGLDKELDQIEHRISKATNKLSNRINPYLTEKDNLELQDNHFLFSLEEERKAENPYVKTDLTLEIQEVSDKLIELKLESNRVQYKKDSLEQLQQVSQDLRGELLKNKVSSIETETNRYLETYFDSEIRVKFDLENGDKLNVTIWKSGNECSFKQLSKGQRGLLNLCFSLSAMSAVADKCGIHFETLMFDEALDGLDTSLKLKAFNLFSELNLRYPTVLVIDHSENLQNMFDKQYAVSIDADISSIKEA